MLIRSLPKLKLEEMELISQVTCGVVVKGHDYKVIIEQYKENMDCETKISFRLFKGEGEYWLETNWENTDWVTYQCSSNYLDLVFHCSLVLNDFIYENIYMPMEKNKNILVISKAFRNKISKKYQKATEMFCNIDLLENLAIKDPSLKPYCEVDSEKLAISILNDGKEYRTVIAPIIYGDDIILIAKLYIEKIDNGYSIIISFKNNEITSMTSPLNISSNYSNLGFTKDQLLNIIKCVEQFSDNRNLNSIVFGRTMAILNETMNDDLKEDSRKFVIESYSFNFGIDESDDDTNWDDNEGFNKACKHSKMFRIIEDLTSEIDNLPLINKLKLFVSSKFVDDITNLK